MSKKVTWIVSGDGGNTARQVRDIISRTNSLHEHLHIVARNAMIQVIVHKQSTPLVDLLNGLSGTSVHVKGLKDWFIKHGRGITIGLRDKAIVVTYPKGYETLTIEEAMEWALTVPSFWVENPPAKMFDGFNYAAELAKLNAKAAKMAEAKREGTMKVKGEIVELTPEQIAAIDLTGFKSMPAKGEVITIN